MERLQYCLDYTLNSYDGEVAASSRRLVYELLFQQLIVQ